MTDETDALKESAKAAQEIAKTAGKVIDAGRGAGGWLDRIFGNGIEHAVARRWSDRELTKRIEAAILDWERLEQLMHKVESRLKEKGITQTRLPPPKIMLPLIEHATMEYEDDLHTLWANLLASAIEPSGKQIERKYVSVLAELSGRDAVVIRNLFAEWVFWQEHGVKRKSDTRYSSGITPSSSDETSVIMAYRLGLILPTSVEVNSYEAGGHDDRGSWKPSSEPVTVQGELSCISFTEFGEQFCKAVIGDLTDVYDPPDWWKDRKFPVAP